MFAPVTLGCESVRRDALVWGAPSFQHCPSDDAGELLELHQAANKLTVQLEGSPYNVSLLLPSQVFHPSFSEQWSVSVVDFIAYLPLNLSRSHDRQLQPP